MPSAALEEDLYRFVLLVILFKDLILTQLLLYIFHFRARLKPGNRLIPSVLKALIDEPQLEVDVSLLVLFLYPFCSQADVTDAWATFFCRRASRRCE
jgi:hypothetical protein